ncbi:hypothetical protein CBR_g50230 [Chara braunii]|uniref:Uncharacterized protein n=1 Tax=Chara braunii TaxID=69332 RepID=A0A388M6I0_CHABU|nr:hypothetical protein CBR_g50230 [Chara braunii]|eukprot:GBG90136.1 hypothetical protein CBR_g50230 [Chara braunii]
MTSVMAAEGTLEEMKGEASSDLEIKFPFLLSDASSKRMISNSATVDCLPRVSSSHGSNSMRGISAVLLAIPLGIVLLISLETVFLKPQHKMLFSVLGGLGPDSVAPSLDWPLASLAGVDGPKQRQTKPEVVIVEAHAERPRVLIITAIQKQCTSVMGEYVVLLGLKNKVDYARLHGMDIEYCSVDVPFEPPEDRRWHKIVIIQEKMRAFPDYDWYVWLEYDTIFTDMAFEIPWKSYAGHSLVLWGMPGALYTLQKLAASVISTNTIYIRNNEISKKLLERLVEVCEHGHDDVDSVLPRKLPKNWTPNDQFAMLYVLSREQALWRQHTFLENNYHISRFWADENDRLEEYFVDWRGEGQFPPFMMSFVGCAFCVDAPKRPAQCVDQFHRAIRFANNQLLSVFNMTHKNLDTGEVVHLTASAS